MSTLAPSPNSLPDAGWSVPRPLRRHRIAMLVSAGLHLAAAVALLPSSAPRPSPQPPVIEVLLAAPVIPAEPLSPPAEPAAGAPDAEPPPAEAVPGPPPEPAPPEPSPEPPEPPPPLPEPSPIALPPPRPAPRPPARPRPALPRPAAPRPVATGPTPAEAEEAGPVSSRPEAMPPAASTPSPSYVAQLLAALERHKAYPEEARWRRAQGTALLRFRLRRDGQVIAHRLERSTGDERLDEAVLAMIQRASPLPPMPDEMAGASLELTVPVRFSLR